jgi:hypothetical protein
MPTTTGSLSLSSLWASRVVVPEDPEPILPTAPRWSSAIRWLPGSLGYPDGLELCVIDSIQSIGVRYLVDIDTGQPGFTCSSCAARAAPPAGLPRRRSIDR